MGDNFLLYSDDLANAQYGYQFSNYITSPPDYDFYGFPSTERVNYKPGIQKTTMNTITLIWHIQPSLKNML